MSIDLSKKNSGILPVGIRRGVFSKRMGFFKTHHRDCICCGTVCCFLTHIKALTLGLMLYLYTSTLNKIFIHFSQAGGKLNWKCLSVRQRSYSWTVSSMILIFSMKVNLDLGWDCRSKVKVKCQKSCFNITFTLLLRLVEETFKGHDGGLKTVLISQSV